MVTVNNVAPVANAGEDKVGDEPSTFTFTGSHTDPGALDTHTADVAGLTSAKTVQGKEIGIDTKDGVKMNEAKVFSSM